MHALRLGGHIFCTRAESLALRVGVCHPNSRISIPNQLNVVCELCVMAFILCYPIDMPIRVLVVVDTPVWAYTGA